MTVEEAEKALKDIKGAINGVAESVTAWSETFSLALEGLAKKINLTGARISAAESRLRDYEDRLERIESILGALTRQQGEWLQ